MDANVVEYHALIRDMPKSERPRERLRDYGPQALSTAELLAIILRTGTSREGVLALAARLLSQRQGLAGLAKAGFAELCNEKGLGEAKAAQLKAALELGRRLSSMQPEARASVRSPADVANLLLTEMGLLEQEHLRVVLLNARNEVMGVPEVYKGSVNSSQVRIGELFREAIRRNCPAIVIVHNHPSGDPTPSNDDISLTRSAIEAGRLLNIEVLDHLVVGHGRYVSLKERKLGFS
ncbi:MAG: DNA repair protein RadC [Dehalococcoidia bacterium]|nr:DNA repair protein RadC [Dehalococcoidia bacterium]